MKNLKFYLFFLFTLIFVLIDFSVKNYIKNNYNLLDVNNVVGGFNLTYLQNRGVAFSMFSNYENFKIFLLIPITFICILSFLVYAYHSRNNLLKVAFSGLIISGAVGNLFDRIYYGYVIDYFHFIFGGYSFPVFNFADALIFIGVFGFCWLSILHEKKRSKDLFFILI